MDTCEREAISVFASIEDAKTALKLMWGHPRRFIAELNLDGSHGVMRASPGGLQSHHDWWIPANTDPRRFVVKTYGPF